MHSVVAKKVKVSGSGVDVVLMVERKRGAK